MIMFIFAVRAALGLVEPHVYALPSQLSRAGVDRLVVVAAGQKLLVEAEEGLLIWRSSSSSGNPKLSMRARSSFFWR